MTKEQKIQEIMGIIANNDQLLLFIRSVISENLSNLTDEQLDGLLFKLTYQDNG